MSLYSIKVYLAGGDEVYAHSEGSSRAEAWERVKNNDEFRRFVGTRRITSYVVTLSDQPEEPVNTYELYAEGGRVMIRRNKPPRFTGVVTMGIRSDIEDVKFLDKATALEMASALRKGAEFLRKSDSKHKKSKDAI